MPKYVDVETVGKIVRNNIWHDDDVDAIMEDIDKASTSDVAPIRHGAWVDNIVVAPDIGEFSEIISPDYIDGYKCNLCGAKSSEIRYPFCPYCGAKMDADG